MVSKTVTNKVYKNFRRRQLFSEHNNHHDLGALGPAVVLELSLTVREAVMPRHLPCEVFQVMSSFICALLNQIDSFCPLSHHLSCKGRQVAAHRPVGSKGVNPANLTGTLPNPFDVAVVPSTGEVLASDLNPPNGAFSVR